MKPTKMIALILALGFAGVASSAEAGDGYKRKVVYVDRATGTKVKMKEKGHYDLDGWKHVTKLKVKVKTPNAKFKVVANGIDYYPTYVSAPVPHYAVDINQAIRGFDVFNDSDADCLIENIMMDAFDHAIGVSLGGSFYGSVPNQEIREVIQAIDALAAYVTLEEQRSFLQPIKILAGRALATSYGRGDYSIKTSQAVLAMIAQIEFSKEFFETRLSVEATYTWTVLLLGHKERLADMMD